jgi:hypothetical protein
MTDSQCLALVCASQGKGIIYYFQNEHFNYVGVDPARLMVVKRQVGKVKELLKDWKLAGR